MRILVAGDFHGDLTHVRHTIEYAKEQGCTVIFQVGDFGWWPHILDGHHDAYIGRVEKMLERAGLRLYWIDGNHENFDDLDSRRFEIDTDGWARRYEKPASATGKLLERVRYVPRGTAWEWDGVRFLAFGGGCSIDKVMRTEGHSWWSQELPTWEQVNAVLDGPSPVDVMLTHDAPWATGYEVGLPVGYKDDPVSNYSRNAIRAMVQHLRPAHLYHGHYHHPYEALFPLDGSQDAVQLVGLGMNGHMEMSWAVLDTEKVARRGAL